jgi:hypothetical protein
MKQIILYILKYLSLLVGVFLIFEILKNLEFLLTQYDQFFTPLNVELKIIYIPILFILIVSIFLFFHLKLEKISIKEIGFLKKSSREGIIAIALFLLAVVSVLFEDSAFGMSIINLSGVGALIFGIIVARKIPKPPRNENKIQKNH